MPRYQRTDFEEEGDIGSNLEPTLLFPPDMSRGFVNPNVSDPDLFKQVSVHLINEGDDVTEDGVSGSSHTSLHPMVQIHKPKRPGSAMAGAGGTGGASSTGESTGLNSLLKRTFFFCPFVKKGKSSNIWSRITCLEKVLLMTTCLLVITIISLFGHIRSHHEHHGKDYCVTPACVTVASAVINAMDTSVDPCHDFYSYSCGGWVKGNPLPDGKSIWGSFNKLWQENQLVMKNVLDQEPLESNETEPFNSSDAEKMARIFYKSCLDLNETTERRGADPLISFIEEVGGWNISGHIFDLNTWSYQRSLHLLHNKYNRGGGLFSWAVDIDERNSTGNVIQIDQSGLILPTRDYYINSTDHQKVIDAYVSYMTKVGVLLGAEEDITRHQMKQVLEFETRVAHITVPAEERRDDERMYHKITLSDLQSIAPFMNWTEYFNFAFSQINYTVGDDEPVVIYSPEYLGNISSLIMEYNATEEGRIILANYFVWSAAQSLTPKMSKDFRDASLILLKALLGSDGSDTAWRTCVTDTNKVMGFALGAMFVRNVFKGRSKELAQSMIQEVKDAFKENLPHILWMDPETRILAREKADAITDMIGFPDFILDPEKLNQKYQGLVFSEDEYFENNLKMNQFTLTQNVGRIRKPVNKTEWEMAPPIVNAYYAPTKNQIVFPAGILQAPFYDLDYPKSLNFGAMGVVMGHELTHAFDDQGREYDKDGNLNQWWRNKTLWHFVQKMHCFIDQYSNYSINGDQLNGEQTLGENIADNGGLKAAFHAYESWLMKHEEEKPLPGVSLTNRQLFFVGFAQVWCSATTPEAMRLQILQDPHSPSIFRVKGTLSNSKEFSNEFNCPLGSPMNPQQKCEVW